MELTERLIGWLARQEEPVYLVGGAMRDRLLGRPLYDLDVAVDGDGRALARRLANHFGGAYYTLDEERSVGRAILDETPACRLVVDVARLRGADLAADLADRDWTINAMAAPAGDPGAVVDLHGGQADLAARVIRPVSDGTIRNDPLRALRAVRQAAELDFRLSRETEALLRRDGPQLVEVPGERVRDELARLLVRPAAAGWLQRLDQLGLLAVIFPELEAARGETQPEPHHLDVLAHSLATVSAFEEITQAPTLAERLNALAPFSGRITAHLDEELGFQRPRLVTVKLAALLHDVGKPAHRTVEEGGRIRFIGHPRTGAAVVGGVLRRLRFSRPEVGIATTIVRHHMRPLLLAGQDLVTSRAVYRFFRDTDDAGVDVILHALADHTATYPQGTGEPGWSRLVALAARMLGDYWERGERVLPPPVVNGSDLMRAFDLEPGPRIGELLEAVREAQAAGEVSTREEGLALVEGML